MRKTLIALMFAAALPTVAMAAMPEGPGPMGGPEGHMMMGGPGHGGEHGPRGKGGPLSQLDLSKEQREQIGKLMGDQWQARKDLVKKYLDKLPAAEQKAMQDEIAAGKQKTQADIRAVLKPDQQKKFDEIVKKQEQRRAEWKEFQAWKAQQPQKAQ
ncbi:LTXXQ domain protein [Pseudomonas veronii]|jgi:Spy/CpxP family protein refolding chaperone|uniref:LTXXQ domain protein n=1 Tax=Pseudomonas veronii TaxID=76761 RepID=A0A0R3B3Z7_PSEVE|nr:MULTISPECIES: LTXXQ domain protein [Pseudomonas]SEB35538.1 protein refolding chaperone Spy/CpxP family [Pseudomonas marginalis]KRP79052.1 LTXXQ domain protein [Pseudomonas veronii]MCT8960142.1 LTXXQ domain protein [Pseudomonas veronii]MCT9822614.1 LTXXQ domain protein [Pseudomonas veronii]NMX38632.1 LTXXQ domain protein [Pseudomonas veronii]